MKAKPKLIKLDSSDLKILSALRANGRETLTKISRDTGIPISLVFDRLKRMEEVIIKKYSCSVDWERLGLKRRVLLLIRLPERLREQAQARLANSHHINNLWRLDNKCGLAAEAMFLDLRQEERFIEALKKDFEDIDLSTHEVADSPKWEGFLTSCHRCGKLTPFGPPRERGSKKMHPPDCLN